MTTSKSSVVASLRAARLAALGLWAGALLMTGAAAAVAFPTMRGLDPVLPAFAAYGEDHWAIAAGHVMRRLFGICDIAQLLAGVFVVATLGAEVRILGWGRTNLAWRVRGLVMVAALALAAHTALTMSPRMNANLDKYWEAAKAGDADGAVAAKAAFDPDHRLATKLMAATLALVVAGGAASILGAARDAIGRESSGGKATREGER